MTNATKAAQVTEWQRPPLCSRYFSVHFEALLIREWEDGLARDRTAHWALGALADGKFEVPGVWLEPVSGPMNWLQVSEDLRVRGVERTRFVASTEPTVANLTLPGATVLPSVGQLLRQGLALVSPRDRRSAANALSALRAPVSAQATRTALANLSANQLGKKYPAAVESWQASLLRLAPFFALAPRLRRIMLSADEAAQRMQGHLIRAIGRHGCFDDREATVSFLDEALWRAQRSLSVRQAGTGGRAHHRASIAGIQTRVEALGL